MRVDRVAAAWEPLLRRTAARQFERDRDALLNILEGYKAGEGAGEAKAVEVIDWDQIDVDVRAYLLEWSGRWERGLEALPAGRGALLGAGEEWRAAFIPILRGLMVAQAEAWQTEMGDIFSAQFGEQFDVRSLYSEEWMLDYAMPFAESVVSTTHDDLNVLLTQALQQGWSIPQAQGHLTELFEQYISGNVVGTLDAPAFAWFEGRLPAHRTEMIARTESIRASNRGSERLFQEWQVEYKQWWATSDDRTCPFCMALHGKIIGVADSYFPKDGLMNVQVGERTVSLHFGYEAVTSPPLHVNCRCTILPYKEEWGELGVEPYGELPAPPVEKPPVEEPPAAVEEIIEAWEEWPENLDGLEVIRGLGGSTGAQLVRDPVTGKQFVMKRGKNEEHLRNEVAADAVYRALGIDVPECRIYETSAGPVKLSEFISGTRTLGQIMQDGDKKEIGKVLRALQKGFAADALLANWDVIGLEYDNILVDATGKVWRIDNGGAMLFRAQGDPKTSRWTPYPDELWTLRDKGINPRAYEVFHDLSWDQIVRQLGDLNRNKAQILDALPLRQRQTVEARLKEMRALVRTDKTMRGDKWVEDYRDDFCKHLVGIKKVGIAARLPGRLSTPREGVEVRDEQGTPWDALRGRNSIMYELESYMKSNGGSYNAILYWMSSQAGSSWSEGAQALKYHLAEARGGNFDSYFWHNGVETARKNYERAVEKAGSEEIYDASFKIWHAFNYTMLQNMSFPNNDRRRNMVRIGRTEDIGIMNRYDVHKGDSGVTMLRGAMESGSLTRTVTVSGNELTLQEVPHHRIMGLWFVEREPGSGRTPFYGDRENELVFMPEGLPFHYVATAGRDEPMSQYWKLYRAEPHREEVRRGGW